MFAKWKINGKIINNVTTEQKLKGRALWFYKSSLFTVDTTLKTYVESHIGKIELMWAENYVVYTSSNLSVDPSSLVTTRIFDQRRWTAVEMQCLSKKCKTATIYKFVGRKISILLWFLASKM